MVAAKASCKQHCIRFHRPGIQPKTFHANSDVFITKWPHTLVINASASHDNSLVIVRNETETIESDDE